MARAKRAETKCTDAHRKCKAGGEALSIECKRPRAHQPFPSVVREFRKHHQVRDELVNEHPCALQLVCLKAKFRALADGFESLLLSIPDLLEDLFYRERRKSHAGVERVQV